MLGADPVCQVAGFLQGTEIGEIGLGAATGCSHLVGDIFCALAIAAVHQHMHAARSERYGHSTAKPRRSSRDQRDATGFHHLPRSR
nr:hypothetical protein [Mycobacterium noviomagense]